MAQHIRGPSDPHVRPLALHPLLIFNFDVIQKCYGPDIHV